MGNEIKINSSLTATKASGIALDFSVYVIPDCDGEQ